MILISFDGASDNQLWERSLNFAKQHDVSFTYFLSCIQLMTREVARVSYKPPQKKHGSSNIGFAPSSDDIATRLEHIWTAKTEGHEIGSHVCGHFDGGQWSRQDWSSEFMSFKQAILLAWERNGQAHLEPIGWRNFVGNQIIGFRAPYLSTSEGMWPALVENGYQYDASTISMGPIMPDITKDIVEFALPLIPEGPRSKNLVAMDYNLYVRHSDAEEKPEHADQFEQRAYDAFMSAFETQYNGERIPLQIGFHFTKMNAGAYWRALERFASQICTLDEVDCITYSEALMRLRNNS